MHVEKLPKSVCDKIERVQRDFLWGEGEGSRKAHLLNWNGICRPKDRGGLGFRHVEEMNRACGAKRE